MKIVLTTLAMIVFSTNSFSSVEEVKKDILEMAESFKGEPDTDGSKKAALEAKIEELKTLIPEATPMERALNSVGVWNQVWGPYAYDDMSRRPVLIDPSNIYQYISENGYYYNFAEYGVKSRKVKTFVKGEYEITDQGTNVVFRESGVVLKKGELDYAKLGEMIESSEVRVIRFPSFLPPVGVEGRLREVYADEDIRINYGSIGLDSENPALFIMKKVN